MCVVRIFLWITRYIATSYRKLKRVVTKKAKTYFSISICLYDVAKEGAYVSRWSLLLSGKLEYKRVLTLKVFRRKKAFEFLN